jgi:hypothetical protein
MGLQIGFKGKVYPSVADPDWNRIQEGKNDPKNIKK